MKSSDDVHARAITTTHLIKGEDLNHHQTLYGARCVEWCVHLAYVAAENCFDEFRPMVFMSVRNVMVRRPVRIGEILELTGRAEYLNDTMIGIRVDGRKLHPKDDTRLVVTGSFLFCTVDERGGAVPHGLPSLVPDSATAEDHWKQAAHSALADQPDDDGR